MIPIRINGIYPILDAHWLQGPGFPPEAIARSLAELPIPVVQLRCKTAGAEAVAFFERWMAVLRQHAPQLGVIVNDRVELALALSADGVHVGQEDRSVPECRRLLGSQRVIGLSTHSREEIGMAASQGADHVGFGPVFGTQTKRDARAVQGLEALTDAVRVSVLPVVAIGGITLERIPATAATGAAGAALISDLWRDDWAERLKRACALWNRTRHTNYSHSWE